MIINQSYKFQLLPTKKQEQTLFQYCGAQRYIFNWGLEQRKKLYEDSKQNITFFSQCRVFTQIKKEPEREWLKQIPYDIAEAALGNLDFAFKNFFRRCKQGQTPGYPKFKKRGMDAQFTVRQIGIKECKIRIPRIGWVKFRSSRPIKGRILSATVRWDINRWYVSICTEQEIQNVSKPSSFENPVGIDVGLKEFAVLSNSEMIHNPRAHKSMLRRYKHLQRKISRRKKGSKNRYNARLQFQKLNRKIRHIRENFHHTLSTRLVKNHDLIAVETLNVTGMMKNPNLAFAIADVGWSSFLSMLEYKCLWYGKTFVKIPRFTPSTKMCSGCGSVKPMTLKDRTYVCENCGLALDRDLNAAKNILAVGLTVAACGASKTSVEAGISNETCSY